MNNKTVEGVGPHFQIDHFLKARDLSWNLCHQLAQKAQTGMTEANLKECLETLAPKAGVEKWWHPIKVRFGKNTRCSFRDLSDNSVTLQNGDLFFLDIGPVFFDHEGDVGQTYQVRDGLIQKNFSNPAEVVFHKLKQLWQDNGLTGGDLYEKACEISHSMNMDFNLKMAGHRLSDFPHALHRKGSLKDFNDHPNKQRWILEVHLLDRESERGYFFEDLLA